MSTAAGRAGGFLSRDFIQRRDLWVELVVRDMKLRYKRSYLGIVWTLANPLAQLLVFGFVFSVIFRTGIPHFTAYLFIGITSWNWFNAALLESTEVVVQNKAMITQPGFPAHLLPHVAVGAHLVHFLLTLPILFGLVLWSGLPLTGALLWLPVVILVQYTYTVSLAMLAACLHVNFRDTQYLLGLVLMLGFFMTPILYDLTIVPESYHWVFIYNPMMHIIDAYRSVLIGGTHPALVPLVTMLGIGLLQLGLFYHFFMWASTGFAEEL